MMKLVYIKLFVLLLVFSIGAFFLLNGLGVEIPYIHFKELESYGLPAGAFILIIGLALAIAWKVKVSEKRTTETIEKVGGGGTDPFEKREKTIEEKKGTFIEP